MFSINPPVTTNTSIFNTLNNWGSKYSSGASTGGALSGVSKLLGGSVGTFLGGPVGSLIGSTLLTPIKNAFAGSSPSKFASHGKTFLEVVIPSVVSKHKDTPSKMLTELSKAYNYMVLFYEAHIKGSSRTNSKQGNAEGLKIVKSFLPNFESLVLELKKSATVRSSKVQPHTFVKNFHPNIKPFTGNHTGLYYSYSVSQVDTSRIAITDQNGNPTTTQKQGSIFNNDTLPILVVAFVIICRKQIFKFLGIKL